MAIPHRAIAAAPWKKAAVSRALEELQMASAHPPGAGPEAISLFRAHVVTIVAAARDLEISKLADRLIVRAEDLFIHARTKPESHYRRRLFTAYKDLGDGLRKLGLVD
jgi:hypothetical protein